ncbi:MAG: HD domain-containing protein [Chitinophagia bacterium]|jgi:HD superfamily phosphohydrolase|nr:HD domain-containing protein [Chitinophagia bacterium]
MSSRKIINDPVYGFITIDDELILKIIAHPYYQRLRRIHQMAMALLVYPGAVHTRLHHSLGAYHLMRNALHELKNKGVEITQAEEQGAKIAILLHDIGHGPFSHALENVLLEKMHHEAISLMLMKELNKQFDGQLQMALDIFTNEYPKKFLHQLVSGQLDVDRMDYLTRDSFFSGVSEGVIGYDRILKMLTVHNGELMVEEKGIYSIEKFLVSRRLMYWQVYLHKTVVCAEQMLVRIIKRAKQIKAQTQMPLNQFINEPVSSVSLEKFCTLDDYDVMAAIKGWCNHEDKILSFLSKSILNRELLKVKYYAEPIEEKWLEEKTIEAMQKMNISAEEASWLVFTGTASGSTYNFEDERINILFKDGSVKDISEVDDPLIGKNLGGKIQKYYFCYLR